VSNTSVNALVESYVRDAHAKQAKVTPTHVTTPDFPDTYEDAPPVRYGRGSSGDVYAGCCAGGCAALIILFLLCVTIGTSIGIHRSFNDTTIQR
jgi:hypothetical protein